MAQTIKLRRSAVAGNVPTTSQLGLGELAINTADGKIYFEKNDGSATIQTIVTTNSQTTGSIEVTGNISGSATSTGSFGRAEIAGNIFLNTLAKANLDLQGNEAIINQRYTNGGIYNAIDFKNSQGIRIKANSVKLQLQNESGTPYYEFSTTQFKARQANQEIIDFSKVSGSSSSTFSGGTSTFTNYGGNISGSATSTGSFGHVQIQESSLSQTARSSGNDFVIKGSSSDGVGMSILGHDSYFKSINFGGTNSNRDAVISYSSTSDNKMTIGTTRASGIINFVTGNGDVSLQLSGGASGIISGSATSTGSFGKGKFSSGIIEGKGSSNTYIELTGHGYPNDNFKVHIAGVKSLHVDNNAGGVMMGYAASATGDSVAIGFGASSAASTVAIGRGISAAANEIRIGESGNTDAYLAQGNATLHIAGINSSGNVSGSAASTGSFGRIEVPSTGSFAHIENSANLRSAKLSLTGGGGGDTTLVVTNYGGGNLLTLTNAATSILYDGRHGQSVAGLYFNVSYTGMLGNLASSATVPGLKFSGDTDTGIGRAAANQLALITGGVEAFRVTSTLISGSAESTGSFGSLVVRGSQTVQGTTEYEGDLNVAGLIASTGDMTLDAGGDIILDADGTDIILKDGGTSFGSFKRASSDFIIKAETQDKDILFKGNDGGSTITALQLDMSEGGNAIFTGNVVANGNIVGDNSTNISQINDITALGNISGSATSTGSFGKLVIPQNGNGVGIEALDGNFSVANTIFQHTANAGNLQFGSSTAGLFHSGGKVRVRVDGGFSAGNEAFKAQDWPVAAGFWVDSSGNMQLGTGTSGGATVQMASLSTTGNFETSGSLIATTGNISGSATSTGSFGHGYFDGNVQVNGNVIAQEFHTEFVSASIVFQSGSTKFGDTLDDVHQFTGSLKVTGSVHNVEGQLYVQKASDPLVQVSDGTRTMLAGYITSTSGLVGTTTNHPLAIRTNNTDRINITNGGNVGINKTAPTDALHVAGGITMEAANAILAMNVTNTTGACQIRFGDTGDNDIGKIVYGHNTNAMSFNTADAERLRIDSAGKVGIGTNAPAAILHIDADEPELFLKHTGTSGDDKTLITFGDKNGQVHAQFFTKLKNDSNGGAFDSEFHLQTAADGTVADRIVVEEDGKAVIFPTANALISGSSTSTGSFGAIRVGTNPGNNNVLGGIAFGDGDTGIYENEDDSLAFQRGGSEAFRINTSSQVDFHGVGSLVSSTSQGFKIDTAGTGATTATYSWLGDANTGIGLASADNLSLIAGGVEQLRIASNTISGSAESTGSFGMLDFRSTVQGEYRAIYLGNTRTNADDNVAIHMSPASLGAAKIVADAPGASDVNFEFHTINGGGAGGIFTMKGDNVFSGSATSTGSFGRLELAGDASVTGTVNTGYIISTNYGQASSLRIPSTANYHEIWNSTNELRIYANQNSVIRASTTDLYLDKNVTAAGNISGSATSTGSFGHLLVNGTTVSGGGGGGSSLWSTTGNKIYYNSDNVGIGTTTPDALLHVSQSSTGNTAVAKFVRPDGSNASNYMVDIINADTTSNQGAGLNIQAGNDSGDSTLNVASRAGTSAIRVLGDGKVGIGTTTPLGNKLHIHVGDSGVDSVTANSSLVIESNTNNYLQFLNPNGNNAGIIFGEHNDIDVASIRHDGGGNFLRFIVNTAEALRITASRNISIGHTSDPSNSAKLGVAGNINIGNGQSSAVAYFENSGTDMYIEGNASKLNIGSVGNTQAVTFPAGGGLHMNAGNISGSATSTGSFGHLYVDKNIRAQGSGNGVYLRAFQNSAGFAVTRFVSDTGTQLFNFGLNSSNNLYYFSYGTDSVLLEIFRTTGNFDFKGNNIYAGNVSGSSTSTGSFGAGYIDNKLGIGKLSPVGQLHVLGSSYNHLELESAAGNVGITFDVETSNTNYYDWRIDAQGLVANGLCIGVSTGLGNQTFDASGTVMTLKSDKKVGIGNTSPGSTLDVTGEIRGQKFAFNDDTNTHIDTFAADQIGFTLGANQAVKWAYVGGAYGMQFMYGNGNAAYPGYTFQDDQDTGMYLAAAAALGFSVGGSEKIRINATALLPGTDNSYDLGSSSKRWANIYSADLHLSNEDTGGNEIDGTEGNWTIQEGEEDLYLLNNKNGKKYKFVLQEIE